MKIFKYTLCFLLSCILMLSLMYYLACQWAKQPLIVLNQPALIIEFKENSNASHLLQQLEQNQLVQHSWVFKLWLKLHGHANHLQAGIYELKPGQSFDDLIAKIRHGDVLTYSFSIIEGTTWHQVEKNLADAPYLKHNKENAIALPQTYPSPEGLLLAETYQYKAGSRSDVLLATAQQALNDYLKQAWKDRAQSLPYQSAYQLLIAASIIEKETALNHEKKLISGVIVNRLKKGMRLQMDPTVIYGLGANFKPPLTRADLKVETAYNTYLHKGLPPGPIAMVSRSSIDAAAHPETNQYLYYVAKGDGSHQFSIHYKQQLRAIKQFLKKDNS